MPLSAAELIQRYESGGQNVYSGIAYTNGRYYPPQQRGSGIYQYIPSTWKGVAASAGIDTSQYPTAIEAPIAVQNQAFAADFAAHGFANWAGNANIMSAVRAAGGPSAFTAFGDSGPPAGSASGGTSAFNFPSASDPLVQQDYNYFGLSPPGAAPGTAAPGTATAQNYNYFGLEPNFLTPSTEATPGSQAAADYNYFGLDPNAMGQAPTNANQVQTAAGPTQFFNNVFAGISDFFVRGGMVLLGIILLALAAWAMLHKAGVAPAPSVRAIKGGSA